MAVLGNVLNLVNVRMLYYMDDKMTISEYEMFGVSNNAYAKDSRGTVGKGIPTVGKQEEKESRKERFVYMVNKTEIKAATFCVLAFVLGLCCALMLGCKTSAKVEGGAEIIELKPLELQELTFPVHDYSKIC
tara:strand:- start:63 stop:458 length:396 start_codon:yes stop_codon:yes gene_type:complete